MTTTETLSNIKVMSEANFGNVSETQDDILYFVEDDGGGVVTEYHSGTSGYLIFPSGMCIQYGYKSSTGTQALTKTYTDTNYCVIASSGASNRYGAYATVSSASQITLGLYSGSGAIFWMTIGQLANGQY